MAKNTFRLSDFDLTTRDTSSISKQAHFKSLLTMIALLTLLQGIPTSEAMLLTDNTCYQCLINSNSYCTLDTSKKCCSSSDTDNICKKGVCIDHYSLGSFQGGYNLTHARSSLFDNYLNLYKCESVQASPCTQLSDLIIPSVGHLRSYFINNEESDYCYYNNTLTKKDYQTLDFQVKFLNYSSDYFVYVWYANSQTNGLGNIVGAYQLNDTSAYKQDGFHLDNSMAVYIVIYRNSTVKKNLGIYNSHTSIQLSLIDVSGYTGSSSDSAQEAPIMVIIVAVSVGGLISSFCIGIIVYMVVKAVRNKRKQKDEEQPEEEQLNSEFMRKQRLRSGGLGTRNQSQINDNLDIEQLDENYDNQGPFSGTVKVQPEGTVTIKKAKTNKSNNADMIGYYGDDQNNKQKKPYDNVDDYIMADMQQRPSQGVVKVKRTANLQSTLSTHTNSGQALNATPGQAISSQKSKKKKMKQDNDEMDENKSTDHGNPNNESGNNSSRKLPKIEQPNRGRFIDASIKEENEEQEQEVANFDNIELKNNFLPQFDQELGESPDNTRYNHHQEGEYSTQQKLIDVPSPKFNKYMNDDLQVEQLDFEQQKFDANQPLEQQANEEIQVIKGQKRKNKNKTNNQEKEDVSNVKQMFYPGKKQTQLNDDEDSQDYGYESIVAIEES